LFVKTIIGWMILYEKDKTYLQKPPE
jgi:hypothetical protein